jgi:hypothetical protein
MEGLLPDLISIGRHEGEAIPVLNMRQEFC